MKEVFLHAAALVAVMIVIAAENDTPITPIPTKCPKTDSVNYTVNIAHESNCTLFYMCQKGHKILRICPLSDQEGNRLHFNPLLQVCDWPESAGCTSEDSTTTEPPTTEPIESTTTKLTTSKPTTTTEPTTITRPTTTPQPTITTEPTDTTQTTTTTEATTTEPTTTTKRTTTTEPTTTTKPTTTTEPSTTSQTTTTTKPTTTAEPTTTTKPTTTTGPSTTSQTTTTTKPTTTTEPTITTKPTTTAKPTTTTEAMTTTELTTTEPSTTTKPTSTTGYPVADDPDDDYTISDDPGTSTPTPVTKCPSDSQEGTTPIKIPHESNCRLYYTCENGTKVLQECDEGLFYDPLLQMCDWENEDSCPKTTPAPKPTPKPFPPTNSTECSETDSEEPALLPHECSCHKYYECRKGEQILRKCPKGEGFNAKVRKCLPLRHSECSGDDSEIREDDSEHEPSATKEPQPTEAWENPNTCKGRCPAVDPKEYTVMLENTDCTRFCKCNNGTPHVYTCPANLEFSPKLKVCEHPDKAGCRYKPENEKKSTGDESSFLARLFHWGS